MEDIGSTRSFKGPTKGNNMHAGSQAEKMLQRYFFSFVTSHLLSEDNRKTDQFSRYTFYMHVASHFHFGV